MTSPPDERAPARQRQLLLLLKIAVSSGLLYVLLTRVDLARLWDITRTASPVWLAVGLALYLGMILVSAWRWGVLLRAQNVEVPFRTLSASFLVATFFNNFLPSNIGGDVVRIGDTARAAGSKTLATTVVLIDRGIGLLGLILVAALGASAAGGSGTVSAVIAPAWLWLLFLGGILVVTPAVLAPQAVGVLLRPVEALHREWVGERVTRLTTALGRFRDVPRALVLCFVGGLLVQVILVVFYAAVARGLDIPITMPHLAVLVPLSFIVQMLPVSLNGLGVREATFAVYFARLGLPSESALALALLGAALVMLFSLSGAVAYFTRRRHA